VVLCWYSTPSGAPALTPPARAPSSPLSPLPCHHSNLGYVCNLVTHPFCHPRHPPAGSAGSEAQQADIRQLLKELELKKAKLNELKGQSRKAEGQLAKLMDDNTDAVRLTPDDMLQEKAYIQVRGVGG
jgi:uncharacterized membrane protein